MDGAVEPSMVLGAVYLVSTAFGGYLVALAALSVLIVSAVMRWVACSVALLAAVWSFLPAKETGLQMASLLGAN
jgi:hypothetical protein